MTYPFVRQYDAMDCGPACISMVAQWHGKYFSLEKIRQKAYITREGVSFLGLRSAAEKLGFNAAGVKIPFERLAEQSPFPCIAHWQQNHFIVLNKIDNKNVWVSDPAAGRIRMSREEFLKGWATEISPGITAGMVLLLEPSANFSEIPDDVRPIRGFSFLINYLGSYKKQAFLIVSGLLAGSLLQLIFPFLTQAIIDRGIVPKDIRIIYLILLGQLALTVGRLLIDFCRGWILLHMGTRLNISIVSDFLEKLLRLPVAYFETKLNGDILQRIDDNNRIENFLTSSSLSILFAVFNFVVFSIYLSLKSVPVLVIFVAGTIVYMLYARLFMPSREVLDNIRFRQTAEAGNKMINIVSGIQEIKLAGNEEENRKDWEKLQYELFRTRIKSLKILQYQTAGGTLIHESLNVVITIVSAMFVINNKMTLGEMLAIQFITGQLNGPVSQIINFMKSTQEARISLDRLSEIHSMEPEENDEDSSKIEMPDNCDIRINDLSFRYEGPGSPWVIKDLALDIPFGKVTAIVGESGSGKTTLLKLILGFYRPENGSISIGGVGQEKIRVSSFRSLTGVVMQEGYIFPDTIIANIAPGVKDPDPARMDYAIRLANLQPMLGVLPSGLRTRVGAGGHGLSQGQKQRILIARVVYKDPKLVILDEATSALDASNEKKITENLSEFYAGRTVLIVAHRLSTVKNADLIAVIEKGTVTETGLHSELVNRKGAYFRLIKDQLELGQ